MGFSSTINSVCPEFSKVFFSVCTASLQAFIIIESFQGGSKNQSWSYNPACTVTGFKAHLAVRIMSFLKHANL